MNHPVESVYSALTSILLPYMGEPVPVQRNCSCCGRAPSEFDGVGFELVNAYRERVVHCRPCQTFFVSAPELMGMRGLSVTFKINVYIGSVFPPLARVIGTHVESGKLSVSIPPARGGIDIKSAMVGLLSCAPTSRWDFLQSRKVTFFWITHILPSFVSKGTPTVAGGRGI